MEKQTSMKLKENEMVEMSPSPLIKSNKVDCVWI